MTAAPATQSLTAVLARHTAGTRFAGLSDHTVHAFRRAFLDYLSCTLAGANLPVAVAVRAWAQIEGGVPSSTVLGSDGVKLAASQAAFVNGTAAHALDFDDGQTRGSVHPGASVFSAALAAAERDGAGMEEFICGVVAGYEVLLRIASAMHPASALQGWHNTAVAGVFGATAAAARIARLDEEATRNALGLASSFSGGIRQYNRDGAEVKRLHPGKAARDGIACAGLAAEGVTGPVEALEGRDGLFRAMVDNRVDASQVLEGLGETFLIGTAYFKPYPCCRHFHAAIDAALELRAEEGLSLRDVAGAEIGLYRVGAHGHDHTTARNLLEAQMSAPCAIAAALGRGRLSAADFDPAAFDDPDLQRLIMATRVYVDEECEAAYPVRRSGVVALQLADGRRVERRIHDPRGEGANPLSDDDIGRKFLDNVSDVIGGDRAARLVDLVWSMDGGGDLASLVALLSRKA